LKFVGGVNVWVGGRGIVGGGSHSELRALGDPGPAGPADRLRVVPPPGSEAPSQAGMIQVPTRSRISLACSSLSPHTVRVTSRLARVRSRPHGLVECSRWAGRSVRGSGRGKRGGAEGGRGGGRERVRERCSTCFAASRTHPALHAPPLIHNSPPSRQEACARKAFSRAVPEGVWVSPPTGWPCPARAVAASNIGAPRWWSRTSAPPSAAMLCRVGH
jgi:hypothetical protein